MVDKPLELNVLGPVSVDRNGAISRVGSTQERMLLTALALSGPESVNSGRLIDLIWGDDPPPSASGALKALVHRIRRRYGRHVIETAPAGYQLGENVETDYAQVLKAMQACRDALGIDDPAAALASAREAHTRFSGDFSQALDATPEGLTCSRALSDLRSRSWDLLLEARAAAGEDEDLITDLEAKVAADPLAERGWEMLMVALYRSGRQAAALGAFQRARTALIDGAGIEPGPALRQIELQILEQDRSLLRRSPQTMTAGTTPAAPWVDEVDEGMGDGVSTAPPVDGDLPPEPGDYSWYQTPVPMTGRKAELETVSALIARSKLNLNLTPNLILINGDAGIGKTRLAGEAAHAAAQTGTRVLYGACDPSVTNTRRAIAMAIDRFVTNHPHEVEQISPATLANLASLSPAIADRCDPADLPDYLHTDGDHHVNAAIQSLLTKVAGEAGVVLILDDLHWASASTVSLLVHLIDNHTPAPICVIATYRPRDLADSSPLSAVLPALLRDPRCTALRLDRLTHEELHELIERSAGHDVPDELTEQIEMTTGGNPYLIVSTLRHLTDAEVVVRRNNRWELAPGALESIPAGVRHLIDHQVNNLPADAVKLLQTAAVGGLRFSLTHIAEVAGLPSGTAIDSIETAALNGLVWEESFDRWRWEHDLGRNIVLDQVSTTRRVQTHWRLAESLSDSPDRDHDEIAHHAIEGMLAAPPGRAAELLADAAESRIRTDPLSAISYATVALGSISERSDPQLFAKLSTLHAIAHLETIDDVFDDEFLRLSEVAQESALRSEDVELIVRSHIFDGLYPTFEMRFRGSEEHRARCWRALDSLPPDAVDERALLLNHLTELTLLEPDEHERATQQLASIIETGVSDDVVVRLNRRRRHFALVIHEDESSPAPTNSTHAVREIRVETAEAQPPEDDIPSQPDFMQAMEEFSVGDHQAAIARLNALDTSSSSVLELTRRARLAIAQSASGDVEGLRSTKIWLDAVTPTARSKGFYDEAQRGVTTMLTILGDAAQADEIVACYETLASDDRVVPIVRACFLTGAAWTAHKFGQRERSRTLLDEIVQTDQGLAGTIETAAMFGELVACYRPEHPVLPIIRDILRPHSGKWLYMISLSVGPVDLYLAKLAVTANDDPEPYLSSAISSAEAAGATYWLGQATEVFDNWKALST